MKQTRKQSVIETVTQTILGFGVLFMFIPFIKNEIAIAVFFIASLVRGYVVRRIFEKEK